MIQSLLSNISKSIYFISLSLLLLFASKTLGYDDKASVVIYRPSAIREWPRNYIAEIDGIAVAEFSSCSYVKIHVNPGFHIFKISLKPWIGDYEKSKIPIELATTIISSQKYYFGFYPYDMSEEDVKKTFIDFHASKGSFGERFGIANPGRASKDILNCSELKSSYE